MLGFPSYNNYSFIIWHMQFGNEIFNYTNIEHMNISLTALLRDIEEKCYNMSLFKIVTG